MSEFAVITTLHPTPIGTLMLGDIDGRLCLCEWTTCIDPAKLATWAKHYFNAEITSGDTPLLTEAIQQIDSYFAGELREFTIPLAMGGTPFQQSAWQTLLTIPYGTTISYAEEARRTGNPAACRAVAAANRANKLCIIVPCHRVIGADGTLTGYTGGLHLKRALLALETTEKEPPRLPLFE